ncbi:MAG: 3-hydroxyacyl-CoA dehydrogenase/enoyl-CoA hydratase family protein [Planctomycetota bacterium]
MTSVTLSPQQNPLITTPSRPMPKQFAVVGAGTIGPDIGYYLKSALPDLKLYLVDIAQEPLDRAVQRLEGYAKKGVEKGKLSEAHAETVLKNIVPTTDYGAMADCDWVLESATENLDLKRKIFAQIEEIVRPEALITSNTSSLPASRLFKDLVHKARTTVTHFFAPAWRNPAVEVIRWDGASPETVDYLRWLFCMTGKVPFETDDALCFMLDRVFDNWCNDAALLLDVGTASEIDSVASELVHAGPFFVLNLAHGNPIIVETNTLQMEEGEHYRPAAIFDSVETWKTVPPRKRVDVEPEKAARIRDRLHGVLFSQSFDIVDRKIATAADLELGCALALGFKKGPFDVMKAMGDEEAARVMKRFAEERPGMPQPQQPVGAYQHFARFVLVDDVDGVKVLTMRRPQALNALSDEMNDELLHIIRTYEDDPAVKGFVITGYGDKAFCAGADIGKFPRMLGDHEASVQYSRDCSRLLLHLDRMEKPVVAALNGIAVGGGLELAMRCHGIVASQRAWIQFPEVTLGIAPGIGGMVVPYRRWPQAAALFHDMLRVAKRLKAPEAHASGIVEAVTDTYDDLVRLAVDRVQALAGNVARIPDGPVEFEAPAPVEPIAYKVPLSREVVGIIEASILEGAKAPTLADALEVGYQAFGKTACTAAAKEGITAFGERRIPDFEKTG